MVTDAEIRRVANEASYRRGCAYQRNGAVKITKRDMGRGSFDYEAEVDGSGPFAYSVTARIAGGLVFRYSCDCPAAGLYEGACKHVVALLKEVQAHGLGGKTPKTAALSERAKRLFSVYEHRDAKSEPPAAPLRLVPKFCVGFEYGAPVSWLELRIGREKLYVMRSLIDFMRQTEGTTAIVFGKDLKVAPSSAVFEEGTSAGLWSMLLDAYRDEQSLHAYSAYFRLQSGQAVFSGKRFKLSPSNLARFCRIMQGEDFMVDVEGLGATEGGVAERAPQIVVTVEDRDGSGRIGIGSDGFLMQLTEDCEWMLHGGLICHVPPEMREPFHRLLEAFPDRRRIDVDASGMADFFSLVLPQMKKAAEVEVARSFAERYKMLPLEAEARIDYLGDGVVVELSFRYGGTVFNPASKEPKKPAPKTEGLIRDAETERAILALLEQWGFQAEDGRFVQPEEERAYDFLRDGVQELSKFADVLYSESFTRRPVQTMPPVTLGVSVNQDSLLELTFSGGDFDFDELIEILRSYRLKRRYHRMKDNTFLTLGGEGLSALADFAEETGLEGLRGGKAELPLAEALYVDTLAKETTGFRLSVGKGFRALVRDIRNPAEAEREIPAELVGVLRDYQATGYRWLSSLAAHGLGGILADDMGLGKTLQTIAFLLARRGPDTPPALVVTPTSLIYGWLDEIARFAPGLHAVAVAGTKPQREKILAGAFDEGADVVVTTYATLRIDAESYAKRRFSCAILDEAQHIKNPTTKAAKAVKRIQADSRFALTGTPIENTLTELWSIFDFLLPGYLGVHKTFRQKYETGIVKDGDAGKTDNLRRHIAPFILRRLKRDVLTELPDKTESRLTNEMTPEQEKVYKAYFAQSRKELAAELKNRGFDASRIKILALLTRLRQIACDPALFLENYEGGSGKLDLLEELATEAAAGGHRMLIFSQFTSMLRRIWDRLAAAGLDCDYLDGATPAAERLRLVKEFNAGTKPVFLISLKAGGVGLNLIGADMVIHYDPWWNPAVEEQAADRAYRIGQMNKVQVVKLVTKDTIEEKIFALQEQKKALIDKMIQPGESFLSKLTEAEIRALFE
ncbi:MAG: DEAD/DEAH box helicase [Schwartzia sp.]|nr:DEAD/DEAH box helicase [Schwartzia sp. (in: firmicutes)]